MGNIKRNIQVLKYTNKKSTDCRVLCCISRVIKRWFEYTNFCQCNRFSNKYSDKIDFFDVLRIYIGLHVLDLA